MFHQLSSASQLPISARTNPRCSIPRVLRILFTLLIAGHFSASVADETSKDFVPRGTVVDVNQKPLADVQITLHRWDGVMSPALQTATTDASGRFEFPSRADDTFYYVVIRKRPFAPLQLVANTEGPVKATLLPAVDSWVEVHSADGEPLTGARVTSLSIRTPGNTETYLWRGMEHLLGLEFTHSDNKGRLNLPPLPEGAIVDIRIDHPNWAQAKLSNAKVAAGRLNSVSMTAGVITTFEFVADPRTPLKVDGLTCKLLLLAKSSSSAETLLDLPQTIAGDQIKFCAHPVKYHLTKLTAPGFVITPHLNRLTIERAGEKRVRFLVRKTVNISGRVVHPDGTPHRGARVLGQIENLSPDGLVPAEEEWAYSVVETNVEGKYTVPLATGRSRVEIQADGFVTDRDYTELDAREESSNEIADFIIEPLKPVRGQVVDENDRPVSGAIVRLRHPSLWNQPEVTDSEGKYAIALPRLPTDLETRQRRYQLDVAAFVADKPLMGITQVDLRRTDSANIVLRSEPSADGLLSMEDNKSIDVRRQKAKLEGQVERYPAGERGQPAPELDGAAWLNTDARSLRDLRGRYVLLDFWFIGCGPCHGDFPSVKLVHERFQKLGVTVISIHDNSSAPEAVREHCLQHGLTFPTVVDQPDGRIVTAYRQLGLRAFPSYFLIGPDGNILENDNTTDGPNLRSFKLEIIRKHVLKFGKD